LLRRFPGVITNQGDDELGAWVLSGFPSGTTTRTVRSAKMQSRCLGAVTAGTRRQGRPVSDNEELMREYFDAWLANDWDRALSFWDDEVVHHVPGHSRLAGDFKGKAAFIEAYQRVFNELGGTIEVVNLQEFLVKGEHTVAPSHGESHPWRADP
jgi:hypothetical protein